MYKQNLLVQKIIYKVREKLIHRTCNRNYILVFPHLQFSFLITIFGLDNLDQVK